jgi:hypothetical protein
MPALAALSAVTIAVRGTLAADSNPLPNGRVANVGIDGVITPD